MLREPYFAAAAAKEHRARSLQRCVAAFHDGGDDPDGGETAQAVQATLLELTARSLADAIRGHCAGAAA